MAPHQERVVTEKAPLDEKLDKLVSFTTSPNFLHTVEFEERERMLRQAAVMRQYSEILGERIAAFPS